MKAAYVGSPGGISTEARIRMASEPGEPFLIADWLNVLMIHLAVEKEALQEIVPFELDLFDGRAYVSLVGFEMLGMRIRSWGTPGRWLMKPIATHPFLNVRTYVRCRREVGIYFLAEWLPNPLSVALGPSLFGLPYRRAKIARVWNASGDSTLSVEDSNANARLLCKVIEFSSLPFLPCEPGSLDEWLMERYTAFTCIGGPKRFFRVWHPAWEQRSVEPEILNHSLLTNHWPLFRSARCISANASPGLRGVWMGKPRRVSR